MAADNNRFQFISLSDDIFDAIANKANEATELLEKWGMKNRMKFATFLYNKPFQVYQKNDFVLDFFQSSVVTDTLREHAADGHWAPISSKVTHVSVKDVPCSQLNMSFFDHLHSSGVVRETGHIVKCFDDVMDDFLVSDELRKVLLDPDCANYGMFDEAQRAEFLFRVFKHLALGGPVNQYEDTITPYLDVTKAMYKELVTVVKDPYTKKLQIASTVFEVTARVDDAGVFPENSQHTQTFCYLIIDNARKQVKLWYHIWM
ncbi:hypothetical protein EMCRGX_G026159 [Ephydatia muelleri]|eukprot:Em0021g902a